MQEMPSMEKGRLSFSVIDFDKVCHSLSKSFLVQKVNAYHCFLIAPVAMSSLSGDF